MINTVITRKESAHSPEKVKNKKHNETIYEL